MKACFFQAYFLQQVINGVTLGTVPGVIAVGDTMVYGIVGMIIFAHGEIYMIGVFVALISFLVLGPTGGAGLVVALIVVLVVSMLLTGKYGYYNQAG